MTNQKNHKEQRLFKFILFAQVVEKTKVHFVCSSGWKDKEHSLKAVNSPAGVQKYGRELM